MIPSVIAMALTRGIFGVACIVGAYLMLHYNDVAKALQINGFLGSIGPFILIGVSALGISQVRHTLVWWKVLALIVGVILIYIGTRR